MKRNKQQSTPSALTTLSFNPYSVSEGNEIPELLLVLVLAERRRPFPERESSILRRSISLSWRR
jgi:hypothetical protein